MQSHERFFERADNFERVVKKIPADHWQAKKEDRFQRGLVLFFCVFPRGEHMRSMCRNRTVAAIVLARYGGHSSISAMCLRHMYSPRGATSTRLWRGDVAKPNRPGHRRAFGAEMSRAESSANHEPSLAKKALFGYNSNWVCCKNVHSLERNNLWLM